MILSEKQIQKVATEFGLRADRSQIGQAAWGVRTPAEPGISQGRLLTHPIQIAQYLATLRDISLHQASALLLSTIQGVK